MRASRRKSTIPIGGVLLFIAISFCLLSIRGGQIDYKAFIVGGVTVVIMLIQYFLFPVFFYDIDKPIILITNMLVAIGLVILYRLEPDAGIKQLIWFCAGIGAMVVAMAVISNMSSLDKGLWIFIGGGVGLLLLSLIFGQVVGGAQNWIKLESLGLSVQPSEFTKIALVLTMASVFREKRKVLGYMPAFIFLVLCLAILVISKDLGAALLYFAVFMIIFYAATSNWLLTLGGIGLFSIATIASYNMFDHVKVRVLAWQNPWADAQGGGYQIVQGLIAIVSGGPFGSGLALGSPRYVPAYYTDYIFSSICEEMGIIMGLIIIALYIMFVIQGMRIAIAAENSFFSLLALGCVSSISIQAFIILGGVMKMMPLTGITLPLISYGGSSMLVTLALIGILQAVAIRNNRRLAAGEVEVDNEGDS